MQFSLKQNATTSAGAYATDGTLIRTLWRGVSYAAGPHTATWDGKDDYGQSVPAGSYELRVLSHNVSYTWDGAIGNTATAQSGPHVFNGYLPIRDMAATDTATYYVTGFNEGQSNLHRFTPANARSQSNLGRVDGFTALALVDADDATIYVANNEGGVLTGSNTSFVYARRLKDDAELVFAAGQEIRMNGSYPNQYYPSVIDLDQNSPTPAVTGTTVLANAATGLAVQHNGPLLAVAHGGQNVIRLFDKTTGVLLRTLPANHPGSLSMTPAGDLWAVVGPNVVRYTNLATGPVVATTITSLSQPLAVGTDPTDEDLVLVADGGGSQQVKAFSRAGSPLWTYGQSGGYPTNGNAVQNDKFWFDNANLGATTFVTVLPDHSFWIGDAANGRCLHFSAARVYLEQIMYQSHSYAVSVDSNNPTRVFNEFLEFNVDYSKPLGDSWTLVRNWRAGLNARYIGFYQGLRQVTTLPNGRTYGFLRNFDGDYMETAELGDRFLRPTGVRPARTADEAPTLLPNGSLNLSPFNPGSNTTVAWSNRPLVGFDGSGNPQWGTPTTLASTLVGPQDPVARAGGFGDIKAPVTTSGVVISLDYSKNNGWHLGGLRLGGTKWLWKASPTGPLDGKGSYDIGNGIQYSGNTLMATGRHVLYGFHGEFWKDAQACQFMHFYDDGLFVGQFGESTLGHLAAEGVLAGAAGNGVSPCLAVVNGETYMWVNDEGGHGPQRWHLLGAGTVQEATGIGPLGSTVVLTTPPATFPQQVVATPGNRQVGLTWAAVPGATGYNVRYSLLSGGPYTVASSGPATAYTLPNLINGTYYYFSVVPQMTDGAGAASAEVVAAPYDTSSLVQRAGQQTTSNLTTFTVTAAAPAAGQAAVQLQQAMRYASTPMALPQVGAQGYVLYNWGGPGIDNANVRAPFTVTKGPGWRNDTYLKFLFDVDAQAGKDAGLYSNPSGQLNIGASDTTWHYLTVCSPVRFADARHFSVALAPKGQPSAAVRYTISENPGLNHIFQFRFKGDVTLTVDNQGGTGVGGTLQAIFFDNAPFAAAIAPAAAAPVAQQLASFTLVNADNSADIRTIAAGATLNLATLPTPNLNIRANTSPAAVGSVVFALSGTQTKAVTDSIAPYALFGDNGNGRYTPWTPAVGTYTLKATPYTAGSGGGTAGTPLTVTFYVTNRAVAKSVYRINTGGNKLNTPMGTFSADTSFWPAPGITDLSATSVANTASSELYQSERRGVGGMLNYSLPLARGQYTVVLHFAENTWNAAGKRVFDVAMEGTKVLDDYDIFKKVGAHIATTDTIAVTVTDGTLNVDFSSLAATGGAGQPAVAALEVLSVPAPLPVTLVGFAAERRGAGALLTWSTASEKANAYFGIESSTDGIAFGRLGQVAGYGTTSQAQQYQFTDANLARYAAGLVYYRLRQVDADGTETFSPVRTVQLALAAGLDLQAWPTPLRPGELLRLRLSTAVAGAAKLLVTDAVGRTLAQRPLLLGEGVTVFSLPEAAQWPKGLYVIRIQQPGCQQAIKVVRE